MKLQDLAEKKKDQKKQAERKRREDLSAAYVGLAQTLKNIGSFQGSEGRKVVPNNKLLEIALLEINKLENEINSMREHSTSTTSFESYPLPEENNDNSLFSST